MRADKLKAFDLSLEPAATRSRYTPRQYDPNDAGYNGLKDFGKGCLLARRLVEVGVPFVEVVLTELGHAPEQLRRHQDGSARCWTRPGAP